ncbi:MAG: V-type ATP synthase subunit E [Methanospirillaceae archaeon]|nr:V-type ATP synthase subunit E [Methanospirillaceae archaeon]
MGLEAVIAEIQEKGRAEAKVIADDADARVRTILDTANEKSNEIRTVAQEEILKTVSHLITQEEAAGGLIVKREVLNAKKELLDEVFSQTLEQIRGFDNSLHKKIITSLLDTAKQEISGGTVYSNERDKPVLTEILAQPVYADYTCGSAIDIDGGIIVESKDGLYKLDYTYKTFLNTIWESGLKDASDILFG